jgi:Mg2+-importing ATPase
VLEASAEGLDASQVAVRLQRYGFNEILLQKRKIWLIHLLKTFNSPFNYLLIFLGMVSLFTGNTPSALLILVMVLLSVFLRFGQEYRSDRAVERLRQRVSNRVTVLRRPALEGSEIQWQDLPIKMLLPGDVIRLSVGDMIPADIRLLSVEGLHVNQSALSGESIPVEKQAEPIVVTQGSLLSLNNLCFMGTAVESGSATAVVLATGGQTCFGNLAEKLAEAEPPSKFDAGLNRLSWLLIRFIVLMVLVILVINGLTKGDWWQAFLFSLAVGVGLTPEMLPMIVTTNLARGAVAMAHQKVIVKRLSAIQNLGAIDVLCTDKTGTLTQNKVMLYRHLNLHGEESLAVLTYAYLNSHFQAGLKNLLDEAILTHAEKDDALQVAGDYQKVAEIPFDFHRRRLSVILNKAGQQTLICKGAVEEVLSVCTQIHDKGRVYPITPALLEQLRRDTHRLAQEGFRIIAVAVRDFTETTLRYSVADETDLTLMGYIAFLDPPKETTAQAIGELNQLGVELKILTGDNEGVAAKICHLVALPVKGILLGEEMAALTEEALSQRVEQTTIFAKLTPEQKARILQALQKNGHAVGFLGDGINDALAIRTADVGLSVENAVDIAKESADMILLEQSLLVLKDGVLEGRKVFGNLIKYIRMTTSSNFGNVFSMAGASFLLPFLPMMPLQILTQNLLYDFSQTATPFDRVDADWLSHPHRWEIRNVERFMLTFGPVSSLFDYVLFGVMWFVFQANNVERQAWFHTGWFIEGLLSQTLIVHLIRTAQIPFVQSWAAPPLLVLTVIIMGTGIYLPYSPLAPYFEFVPLPGAYFLWLLGILLSYALLTQRVKRWFIKKFGYG